MKKPCAIFTIVKNEQVFLPIWIKHYKNFFDKDDIFILDHESNDGSTSNLDVNIIKIHHNLGFDHAWLVNQVQSMQKQLLDTYETVLFAEADELIYTLHDTLYNTIIDFKNSQDLVQHCIGYEIMQNIEEENSIANVIKNCNIFEHRKYWFRSAAHYDKPLLTKIPLKYCAGFHHANVKLNQKYNLFMCHLHRFDFELMLERHRDRANWNLKNDGQLGFQHKISERKELLKYYNSIPDKCHLIPEEHRALLISLHSI